MFSCCSAKSEMKLLQIENIFFLNNFLQKYQEKNFCFSSFTSVCFEDWLLFGLFLFLALRNSVAETFAKYLKNQFMQKDNFLLLK